MIHEVFAQIYEGEVKNITIFDNYSTANYITKATYNSLAFAVNCLQHPCGIGDKYHDSQFWRVNPETGEETLIPSKPTQEQQVSMLKAENEELTLAMAEMIGGM